jgi:hypothetical protein
MRIKKTMESSRTLITVHLASGAPFPALAFECKNEASEAEKKNSAMPRRVDLIISKEKTTTSEMEDNRVLDQSPSVSKTGESLTSRLRTDLEEDWTREATRMRKILSSVHQNSPSSSPLTKNFYHISQGFVDISDVDNSNLIRTVNSDMERIVNAIDAVPTIPTSSTMNDEAKQLAKVIDEPNKPDPDGIGLGDPSCPSSTQERLQDDSDRDMAIVASQEVVLLKTLTSIVRQKTLEITKKRLRIR